jgi:hypothetical protein
MSNNSIVNKTLDWIIDIGVNGGGFLSSVEKIDRDRKINNQTDEEAIDSIIFTRSGRRRLT